MGPILAGALIDALDLFTRLPVLGLLLGSLAGYFLARSLGQPRGRCLFLGALAGLYCAIPATHRLPLATLVGVYARLAGRRRPA